MSQREQLQAAIQAGIAGSVRRPHFSATTNRGEWYVYEASGTNPLVAIDGDIVDYVDPAAFADAIADALNAVCAGTVPTVGQTTLDAARAMEAER